MRTPIIIIAACLFISMTSCQNEATLAKDNEAIKTEILNDRTLAELTEEEQTTFTEQLVNRLKNDIDFKIYIENMKLMALSRTDSTKPQSSESKMELINAIKSIGSKFPELRKLDKETQKLVMAKAGYTVQIPPIN